MVSEKTALVSADMPESTCSIFGNLGYGCVRLPGFDALAKPVSSHPDMLFSRLSDGKLLCDAEYYRQNKHLLDALGVQMVVSERALGKEYPRDIAFDALIFEDCIYGRLDALAPEIIEEPKVLINVKQGYALCSTLVTDRCAVTADSGIYDALKNNGVDVLKTTSEGVRLEGYGCGFIGGASAFDPCSNTVIFFGNVTEHPDYGELRYFLSAHGHEIICDETSPLTDFGGAKLIFR